MSACRAAAACVLAALVALAPTGASAGGGDSGSTGVTYSVGMRRLDLVDDQRSTPADAAAQQGPIAASDARALPTTVLYPAVGGGPTDPGADPLPDADPRRGRFPVILFTHGAPGEPHDYRSLLVRWASQGYVVVAPQYPITSTAGPTEVAWADARDQVRDARHVLSEVLALDRVPWSEGGLGGHLDRRHVAAAGHSMGGLTTLALVSECCRDRRVDAAVVLAGVSQGETGPRIEHPRGPILFAHAMLDVAVSIRSSERAFRRS
jgi:predicted dienelactone hydrolase